MPYLVSNHVQIGLAFYLNHVEAEEENDEANVRTHLKKKRQPKGKFDPVSKTFVRKDPRQSHWFIDYVQSDAAEVDDRCKKQFRQRFRCPRSFFINLVNRARTENWFPERFEKPDCTGKGGHPLELLILGSLRYLGRGWTFDDLEESTGISAEVHRVFFHKFIEVGATILFDQYVKFPKTKEEIQDACHEFSMAGFDGCVGSADATHVVLEKCQANLKQNHKGFKSSHTTRAYNIIVNHRRRILSTTSGHGGRVNDKTLQNLDSAMRGMFEGRLLQVYDMV